MPTFEFIRHIPVDDRSGTYKGIPAYGNAADNGGIGPDGRPFFHQRLLIFVFPGNLTARVVDIGKNHTGTAEHVILQGHAFIDRDIILDLAAMADLGVRTDNDILADIAGCADAAAGQDM